MQWTLYGPDEYHWISNNRIVIPQIFGLDIKQLTRFIMIIYDNHVPQVPRLVLGQLEYLVHPFPYYCAMDTSSWVPHCWILYRWVLAGGRESQRLRTSWNHSNTSTLHTKSRGWFRGLRADTDLGRSPRPSLLWSYRFTVSPWLLDRAWQSYAHPNPTFTALAIQEPQLAHGSMPPRQLLPGGWDMKMTVYDR